MSYEVSRMDRTLLHGGIGWRPRTVGDKAAALSRRLRQIDLEFMRRLHRKVNIVPVIAKADTLTEAEVVKLKRQILADIEEHKIQVNTCNFTLRATSDVADPKKDRTLLLGGVAG